MLSFYERCTVHYDAHSQLTWKLCNIIVKDKWSLSNSFHISQHYLLEISHHWKILEGHGFCIKFQNTVNHRSSFFCIACFKSISTSPDQALIATIKYWLCYMYAYHVMSWGYEGCSEVIMVRDSYKGIFLFMLCGGD